MAPIFPETMALNTLDNLKVIIRGLLRTVREKHGIVTIEPQLTKEHFDETIQQLPELCPSHDFKVLAECAIKSILYEIATQPESEQRFPDFCNLLDLALVLTELELTDVTLPFVLIEELFDSQTIDSCQQLFEYLESRVERLTTDMEGTKGKGPVLLRLCNELLRRLSKAEDTIFCGRILIFLSKSFILGERSGVNLRGEFNVENTTSFDQIPAITNGEKMEVDQQGGVGGKGEGTSEGTIGAAVGAGDGKARGAEELSKLGGKPAITVDSQPKKDQSDALTADELYPIFWSLQNYFSNPTRLFVKEVFETFKKGLAATMAKFKAVDEVQIKQGAANRIAEDRGRGGNSAVAPAGEKRKRGSDEDLAAHFNPKYLTSRDLFELELSDLTFRRHVLVQALILIDFLLSLTPAAKERWAEISSPNKAVQFSFTLSAEDEKWATKTRSEISDYLAPNFDGRLFVRSVETILTRDKNWVQWKAENCLSFEKLPVPEAEVKASMERAMDICRPTRPYAHAMGAPALGRLWKEASKNPGLEGLKRKERHVLPSPESFRPLIKRDEEEIADALRPDQAEAAATSKASKIWRALRITSRDRFHLFNKFVDTPDEHRNELEMLFEIEENEQEAKRQKLEEAVNGGGGGGGGGGGVTRDSSSSSVPETSLSQSTVGPPQQRPATAVPTPVSSSSASMSGEVGKGRAASADPVMTRVKLSQPSPVSLATMSTHMNMSTSTHTPTHTRTTAHTPTQIRTTTTMTSATSPHPHDQQQQRIENVADIPSGSTGSTQPEMKLHRIENAVSS